MNKNFVQKILSCYPQITIFVLAFSFGWMAHWYLKDSSILRPVNGVVHSDTQGGILHTPEDPGQNTDFAQFWNTWAALDTYFVPAESTTSLPTTDTKVASAIAGLVASYNDPYTQFLPRKQAEQLKEVVRGDFEGIGAGLNELPGQGIMITGLIEGAPAMTAGIKAGDIITAVDGQSIIGRPLDEVVKEIRGLSGTDVTLSVERSTGGVDIVVTRGVVVLPTVASKVVSRIEKVATSIKGGASTITSGIFGKSESVKEEKRFYRLVRLTSFSGSSVEQFETELKAYASSDERAFILDLRNNPGGDLSVATAIASHFLPKGKTVALVRDFKGNEEVYASSGLDTLSNKTGCIAVVVNGNSASASEILAAALSEQGVAKTVGERTFGKGSVQQLVEVGDLGTLKVTVAHWYTPNGVSISKEGFTPEFSLDPEATATTGDNYIDTALEVCGDSL